MMLPLPRLDDENFEDIFNEARRQIPGLTSEWTDFNYHDPGITLLQLLAWLKEMQQFYLDSIGDIHRIKYLKLLNCLPRKAESAWVDIFLRNVKRDVFIPRGTPFFARGVVFELQQSFWLLDNSIECLLSFHKGNYVDITNLFEDRGNVAEYVFGEDPEVGDQFLIGFKNKLPKNRIINLFIELFALTGMKRNKIEGDFYPLAQLQWHYWDGSSWKEVNLIRDDTCGLIQDGYIVFSIDNDMKAANQGPCSDKLFWLKCTLIRCDYDIPPKLANLSIHTVRAVQRHTQSEVLYFDGTGEMEQKFCLDTFLSLMGQKEVQIMVGDGLWKTWKNFRIEEGEHELQKWLIIDPNEEGKVPQSGDRNIRVICRNPEWEDKAILGSSDGYPSQEYFIEAENILEGSLEIQVGIDTGNDILWQDWKKTEDLLGENPESLCYIFDTKTSKIVFGDGRNGSIPCKGIDNIRIISCAQTKGAKGNINEGEIDISPLMKELLEGVEARNKKHAEGGRDEESIEDAIIRFRKNFSKASRAVTVEDYERIVKETPGLLIDKVRAIPNYKPRGQYQKAEEINNCVTVVVKASSVNGYNYGLNDAYIENIRRHIENYRLVTTEVNIIPPRYIGISVYCVVEVKPYYKDIKKVLEDFFARELDAVNGKRGFGQNVDYGDIYGKIESIDGVKRVISLSFEPHGLDILERSGGDIYIPPEGLTYLKTLELEVKE